MTEAELKEALTKFESDKKAFEDEKVEAEGKLATINKNNQTTIEALQGELVKAKDATKAALARKDEDPKKAPVAFDIDAFKKEMSGLVADQIKSGIAAGQEAQITTSLVGKIQALDKDFKGEGFNTTSLTAYHEMLLKQIKVNNDNPKATTGGIFGNSSNGEMDPITASIIAERKKAKAEDK